MNNYEYPTDEQLKKVTEWDYKQGFKSLIEFIESIWWTPEWGFHIKKGRDIFWRKACMKLELHTGGWSGNEDIIEALQGNFMFWGMCFYKHIVGGHFWFEIRMGMWKR